MAVYPPSVRLGPKPLETHDQQFSQLKHCGHSTYATSSLTRGLVCLLQLLLVLASAVILGSESLGIHDHILLSQIRDSPNMEGQVPILISLRAGWPSYTEFPFRRLLRLAELRWRYSTLPPYGWTTLLDCIHPREITGFYSSVTVLYQSASTDTCLLSRCVAAHVF
jgi:hypothetical protein